MPNYRLTHKITGTTVPATAGYYGAHNQSLTKWKQAGAEMYQWKSDDFASVYFMGATFDTDAYKTVTISEANDAAFDGAYVYSSTISKWLKSTTHSIYKDGTTWKLTDGVTTYTAPDNGLNIPPATFTRTLGYTATLSVTSSAKFAATSLSGTWYPVNGGTGTPVYSEYTIGDSWYRAETQVFESLADYFGCTEGNNCFRGFLPVMGDGTDSKYVDVWSFTSGGSEQFDISRVHGENGLWCLLRCDVRIESLWKTRQKAMEFAGAVCAWLKDKSNLSQTGCILLCQLTKIPEEPKIYRTDGQNRKTFWQQTVELEFVFLTEGIYS